ncbi:MAG: ROK family glucokinase [Clostridia bacterium]|nr:ROK family glucokinase [Clostridia bacterium]
MVRVGIDVGGTGIQVGVLDEQMNILAEGSIPTSTTIPFAEQITLITECVLSTVASAGLDADQIESVGVGIPGIANKETGEVVKCPNMGWNHVPFRSEFKKHLNVPIFIDNDANVAALAESVAGVSAGTSSSVFITIGTGIGSGIIINGKIWNGFHGIGGELGHVIFDLNGVPCSCGNHGCLERYCSATAVIRMAREAIAQHPDTLMLKMVNNDILKIEARTIIDAARASDPLAMEVFARFTDDLAQAIASVVNFLDPEVIVLGGGVSKAGSFLLDPLSRKYKKYVLYNDQPMPKVKLAVLGAKAGIIGAAMLS